MSVTTTELNPAEADQLSHVAPDQLSPAEAEERHYTPEEAAEKRLVPIGARMIRKLAYAREIPHTNNGRFITLQLRHCRAISAMFEVAPFTEPLVSRKKPA
ncbi:MULTISPECIES: hypothetical protein [Actinomycetes]|uniref:hypothetical protein n=1 Tax=Actinomycetes TaxID=1760 RepID=UPI0033E2B2FE